MHDDRIIVGLDIGTTKVVAMVGRMNEHNKLEILGYGEAVSEGVKDGIVSNIAKTVTAIDEALRSAEQDSQIMINVVNVGIAGKYIHSSLHHGSITLSSKEHEITIGDIERLSDDMYRTVTDPGTEIIHVLPQDYTVDFESNVKDPVGMAGVKLEGNFNIITATTNSIRNLKRCVDRTGLEVEHLILESLSSSMAVLSEEEKEAGVALVDIGGGTTDVSIYYDGIVRHTAVIPFGGDSITSDVKHGCGVLQEQAEKLKVKFGQVIPELASEKDVVSIPGIYNRPAKEVSIKNLSTVIEARMDEMLDLVISEIQKTPYINKLAAGIVLTGGGAKLKNLQEMVERKTGLDTRIGYPVEYLGKIKNNIVKDPKYSTAIGLVLVGFKSLDSREDERAEESYQQSQSTKSKKADVTPKAGRDFFSTMIKKAKDLLTDDFDDETYY